MTVSGHSSAERGTLTWSGDDAVGLRTNALASASGSRFWFYHLLAVWPWESYLTFLSFIFLIGQVGILIVPLSQRHCKDSVQSFMQRIKHSISISC